MSQNAESALETLRALIAGLPGIDGAEIYAKSWSAFEATAADQKLESRSQSENLDLSLRLKKGQKISQSYTQQADSASLKVVIERCLSMLEFAPDDPEAHISVLSFTGDVELGQLQDSSFRMAPEDEKINRLLNVESRVREFDARIKRTRQTTYSEAVGESWLWTLGSQRALRQTWSQGEVSTLAVAEAESAAQMGWGADTQSHYYDLDWSGVPKTAAQMACKLLGGQPVRSGQYRVVFMPEVVQQLMRFLGQALAAESIERGQSYFKRSDLGRKLLASEFNLIDDPHARKRVGSCYWDAEGHPTQKLQLFQAGVLQALAHTHKSARLWGESSTGNAVRGTGRASPSPGFHNLVLEPGRKDFVDLIRDTQNGLVVYDVSGMHTANSITGEFSLGASGTVVTGGEERQAFGNVALSGNIQSLLKSMVSVGRDLRWTNGVAAPSILCENVSVAGASST